jgi:hypothetical protein
VGSFDRYFTDISPRAALGVYYCSNWATPGNCHDMSLLSGFLCVIFEILKF